jgi:ankyrin repeat protein
LLENGASVNALCLDGCTALHLAVLEEYFEIVQLLLDHGATLPMNCDGETPLEWAEDSPEMHQLISSHFAKLENM